MHLTLPVPKSTLYPLSLPSLTPPSPLPPLPPLSLFLFVLFDHVQAMETAVASMYSTKTIEDTMCRLFITLVAGILQYLQFNVSRLSPLSSLPPLSSPLPSFSSFLSPLFDWRQLLESDEHTITRRFRVFDGVRIRYVTFSYFLSFFSFYPSSPP